MRKRLWTFHNLYLILVRPSDDLKPLCCLQRNNGNLDQTGTCRFPPFGIIPRYGVKTKDKLKAADLRMSLLMGKIPEDSGLLIDAKTFAHLLSISSRTLSRLIDLKAVPMPVHLGRLVRWRLAEVLEWIEADCPPQKSWTSKSIGAVDRRKK